jgi:hypothetical protein
MKRAEWLDRLRRAWDDADAVGQDMLRPPRERNLGPVKHRELYAPAADAIEWLLAHPPDDGAPTDPDATPVPTGEPGGAS